MQMSITVPIIPGLSSQFSVLGFGRICPNIVVVPDNNRSKDHRYLFLIILSEIESKIFILPFVFFFRKKSLTVRNTFSVLNISLIIFVKINRYFYFRQICLKYFL